VRLEVRRHPETRIARGTSIHLVSRRSVNADPAVPTSRPRQDIGGPVRSFDRRDLRWPTPPCKRPHVPLACLS
jgi:hypothetical protein